MVYNLTGIIANSTNVLTFTQGVNNVLVFGWLGVLLLIGITVVVFGSFQFMTNDTAKSMSATAFIAFGLAILLRAMDLIPNLALFITLIAAGATIALLWQKG